MLGALIGLACGAGVASAQGVTFLFEADRTSAEPGETVRWTVSASFSGYDDPTAYFGSFSGAIVASDRAAGVAQNFVSGFAQVGAGISAVGATIDGVAVSNLALLGNNDPANPITLLEFDVRLAPAYGETSLEYIARGTATVYPDDSAFTLGDAFTEFTIESDSVRIDRPAPFGSQVRLEASDPNPDPGDLVTWRLIADFPDLPGDGSFLARLETTLTRQGYAGEVVSVRATAPGVTFDEPDVFSIGGIVFEQAPGGPLNDARSIQILEFRTLTPHIDGAVTYGVEPSLAYSIGGVDYPGESVAVSSDAVTGENGEIRPSMVIRPPDPAPEAHFGIRVDADEGRLLIAETDVFFDSGRPGEAYLFDALTGALLRSFQSPRRTIDDGFGYGLLLQDGRAIIASPGLEIDGVEEAGAVFVFDAATGALLREILPPEPTINQQYGTRLSASGDRLLVGGWLAPTADLYDLSRTDPPRVVAPPDPASTPYGFSFAIDGDLISVADYQSDRFAETAGIVWLLDADSLGVVRTYGPDPAVKDAWFTGFVDAGVLVTNQRDSETGDYPVLLRDPLSGAALTSVRAPDPDGVTTARLRRVRVSDDVLHGETELSGDRPSRFPVFDRASGLHVADLANVGTATSDGTGFGLSRAITQGRIALSDFLGSDLVDRAGAVYVYDLPAPLRLPCNDADLAPPFGVLDLSDINAFIGAFVAGDALADLTGDSLFDLAEIIVSVDGFTAGCP